MTETARLKGLLYELWSKAWKPAAARAGELMHTEMVRLGVWQTAQPADRAAVCWAVVTGHMITAEKDAARIKRDRSTLVDLLQHVVRLCDRAPYQTARTVQLRQVSEIYRRLTELPEGWPEEVLRRVVMGGEDLTRAVAEARTARSRLKGRGIEDPVLTDPDTDVRQP